jgi:hypothetical protein
MMSMPRSFMAISTRSRFLMSSTELMMCLAFDSRKDGATLNKYVVPIPVACRCVCDII